MQTRDPTTRETKYSSTNKVKERKQYYRRKRRKLLEPELHSSEAQSWRGADTSAPLWTLTSPLSLFSKDMWSTTLRLGLASILRALEVRCGCPFIALPRRC